jgi:hypothetical protein
MSIDFLSFQAQSDKKAIRYHTEWRILDILIWRPHGGSEKLTTKTPLQKAIFTMVGGLCPPGGVKVLQLLFF